MTENAVTRKVVSRDKVFQALLDGVKNGLTADQVADKLGQKRSTFNQALNKLRADFVAAGKADVFPQLVRKSKAGSSVSVTEMIAQAEALTQKQS